MGNYVSVVLDRLREIGDGDAVVAGDRRISGTDAVGAVLRYAAVLRDAGLRTGDGVAVFAGNSPEALFLLVAVHFVGCRLVFVPPEPGNSELEAFLRKAEVDALVFDPEFADRTTEIVDQVTIPYVLGLAELTRDHAGLSPDEVADERDVTTLMYTGGTTGMPKLVTRSHSFYQGIVLGAAANPGVLKSLVCTLITHTSGHTGALSGLLRGATVILMETFDAGTALSIMDRERVAMVGVVPPMLYELLDHPGWPAGGFPALQAIFYTGAAAAPARLAEAIRRFGPVLLQAYGSTEAGGVTVLLPAEHDLARPESLSSCGRPIPGVEVELRGTDGEPVALGEVGELHVRSAMVMDGYWHDPERTAEVLDADGWYHTGDLARQDENGYLYLVGRTRDIIVTGETADNVYAKLLDDFLMSLPDIRDAAAIGLPGRDNREDVHVVLVLRDPAHVPDLNLLTKKVVDELGDLYAPTGYTIAESLPHTTVGKTDKRGLRASVLREHGETGL